MVQVPEIYYEALKLFNPIQNDGIIYLNITQSRNRPLNYIRFDGDIPDFPIDDQLYVEHKVIPEGESHYVKTRVVEKIFAGPDMAAEKLRYTVETRKTSSGLTATVKYANGGPEHTLHGKEIRFIDCVDFVDRAVDAAFKLYQSYNYDDMDGWRWTSKSLFGEISAAQAGVGDIWHMKRPVGSDHTGIINGKAIPYIKVVENTVYHSTGLGPRTDTIIDKYSGGDIFGSHDGPFQEYNLSFSYQRPKFQMLYKWELDEFGVPTPNTVHRDPLIFGLNGAPVRTLGHEYEFIFDHDGDGFAELTGWAAPGSGMLTRDRNGNNRLDSGAELFGDFTPLESGGLARNGFEALASYDLNNDGKIDSNDSVWSELKMWQFDESIDLWLPDTDHGKLSSLDELGISAIYLNNDTVNETDESGNTVTRTGLFEWADGTTGQVAEYNLARDIGKTEPTIVLDIPQEMYDLPYIDGYGGVYDLYQSMLRDTSGQLQSMVEAFVAETDRDNRQELMTDIIFQWTGVDAVDIGDTSRIYGGLIDARKVAALRKLYGIELQGTEVWDQNTATHWNDTYDKVFEKFYSLMISQSHLKELGDLIEYGCNAERGMYADFSVVATELMNRIAADPAQGKTDLSEFVRTVRGLGFRDQNTSLSFREHFIQQDPSLAWIFDTGGLPVYDQLGQGDGRYYPHMWGTWGSDAVKGHPTAGDGYINGLSGDDVLYGTDRNEKFFQESGDALIVAGGGNDRVYAGEGDDIIDGGSGNTYALAA
jgi:hypothetical protein